MEQGSAINGRHRVQPVLNPRRDTEVRARASQALKKSDHKAALKRIDEGIKAIRRFLADYQQEESEEDCTELQSLVRWRREVEREQPMGPLEKLEQQLELSVELEDYEEAARIRDQIRRLQESEK